MDLFKGTTIKARNGQRTDTYDQNGKPVWGLNSEGDPVCYSPKRNKPGEFCDKKQRGDSGRCKLHNRGLLRGAGHHNAKPGLKYSKTIRHLALPDRYHAALKDSMKSKNQISSKSEVALIDARMQELEESLNGGDSVQSLVLYRETVKTRWREFNDAVASKDGDRINNARAALHRSIETGLDTKATWNELIELSMKRKNLVDSETRRKDAETRRRVQAEQMIPLGVLKDYTVRVIDGLRFAVIENAKTYKDRLVERVKAGLLEQRVDPEAVNIIMAVVTSEAVTHFESAARMILSDSSRAVASLYTSKELPEIPVPAKLP